MTIEKYLKKTVILRTIFLICRYLLTSINLIVGCFLFSVLIDKCIPLPIIVFHIYWFFILVILLIFFVNLLIRVVENVKYPYKYLQEELSKLSRLEKKDEIVNAWLIEQKLLFENKLNFSKELAIEYIDKVKILLSKVNLNKIVGFDKLLRVLPLNFVLLAIIYILYSIPPYVIRSSIYKIVFTRRPEILGIFISPKNCKVPYKSLCEIKVIVDKDYTMHKPELFIKRGENVKFYKTNFDSTEDFVKRKIYKYKIISVDEPIFYKIKFRGVSSKVYTIEPILYPNITQLLINVYPPQYTQIKPYTIQSFVETKYIFGSRVIFRAECNKKLKDVNMYLNNNRIIPNIHPGEKVFTGQFVVMKNSELYFTLYDIEGNANETIRYKINVVEDKPPEIEIISPDTDIVVMPNSIIPIVYSIKDDISVSKVEFTYSIRNKQEQRTTVVKKYTTKTTESIEEYIFDLSKLQVSFGDIIIYNFTVYDNDIISGPKYSITKEYRIEIFKYEQQHQEIQKELQQFIEKTVDLLGKEIELYQDLKNSTTEQVSNIQKIITEHKKLNRQFEDIESLLNSILDKMFTDPYTTMDTYSEFKNLSMNLDSMRNNLIPNFLDKLNNYQLDNAKELQEQIIENLERATMLSKDIMKRQNMENIVKSMDTVSSAAKNIMETLQGLNNQQISNEELVKVKNLLKEIEEKLMNINNLLKNIPEELPQEFVNRRDVKNLDLVSPMNILQDISQMISRGDISSAIKQLEQLIRYLDLLSKTLSEANFETLNFTMSNLNTRLNKLAEELDSLILAQQQVFQTTKEIDEYRISEMLKQQEKIIYMLIEKVKNIIAKINNILQLPQLNNLQLKEIYRLNSFNVVNNLEKILVETLNKKLIQTPKLVSESVNTWQQNVQIVNQENKFIDLSSSTLEVYKLLKELDEMINTEIIIDYPQKIQDKNSKLYEEQNRIRDKTKEFIEDLREVGKKSFIISTDDVAIALQAQNEMGESSSSLLGYNFPKALQHQNSAINLLVELKNNISERQNQLKEISQKFGQPMSSGIQSKPVSGGKVGILTGRVVLPTAREYLPPKELRKDIIQSLSEKYPSKLQKTIEDYYRELLK